MINIKHTPNELRKEKSPYLLQHAYNPVSWYPWGEKAFHKAKEKDMPVFLSIGYSTCHWCHVMEKESFEDSEIAEILNENFVCVKVDREERPDIDTVYMEICQTVTGSGGWPMTIIMSPDQKPFFAATYIPKLSRYGITGLIELLPLIAKQWKLNKNNLLDTGNRISIFMKEQSKEPILDKMPQKGFIYAAVEEFKLRFDKKYGGFGRAPKFPAPHNLLFLLRYTAITGDSVGKEMAEKTLIQMFRGGIFDHIGGGFSRYSTDVEWLVPHFEKMLYDNALLSYVYLEAFQITERLIYKKTAVKTLDYVLAELTDPLGGFYCGQDADSEGVEGKYYVLDEKEILELLGKEKGKKFNHWFGITKEGNFDGKNIPNLILNENYETSEKELEELCSIVYEYRKNRTTLHKDDKVLTSWNGLMIAAFAKAYCVTGNKKYLEAAKRAWNFISTYLMDKEFYLKVRWRDGEAANNGNLEDYAFSIWSLLEIYRASFELNYLQQAIEIAKKMILLFFDEEQGGFYFYSSQSEVLISRPKEVYDGAIPSGNSVAALLLEKLYKITGEQYWKEYSDKQLKFLSGYINEYLTGYSFFLVALEEILFPAKEMIFVLSDTSSIEEVQDALKGENSFSNTILVKTRRNEKTLLELAPYTLNYPIPDKSIDCYICEKGSCKKPIDISELQGKNHKLP